MSVAVEKIPDAVTSPENALALLPESATVARTFPSTILFQLEQAGEIATEVLDERVAEWTREGRSQRWIADEIGCSQSAVSRRQQRLGVSAAGPQAGKTARRRDDAPRIIAAPEEEIEDEIVPDGDVEIIEPDPAVSLLRKIEPERMGKTGTDALRHVVAKLEEAMAISSWRASASPTA